MQKIREIYGITPVHAIGDYLFKRDDLFIPFDFSPVNGSKLRQALLLCKKNEHLVVSGGISTGTSVLSPQAVIVASVAKYYGVRAHIVYGGTTYEGINRHRYAKLCNALGADVEIINSGYNSAVSKRAAQIAERTGGLHVKYGFDLLNNTDVFLDSVSMQVANIPEKADNLVVTTGSAITLIGILVGIAKYGKDIKNIIAVGCAPNRMAKIKMYAEKLSTLHGINIDMTRLRYYDCYNKLKGYKYENTRRECYGGIVFHPRYEAKAFAFMREFIPRNQKTIMWITGHEI